MFPLLTLNKQKTSVNAGGRKGHRGFSGWVNYAKNVRETLRISEIHGKYTAEKTTFSVNILDCFTEVYLETSVSANITVFWLQLLFT